MALEQRLARVRAEMIRLRLVIRRQPDGSPWAFSLRGAAISLGCTQTELRAMLATGRLHALDVGEPMISATQVKRLRLLLARR